MLLRLFLLFTVVPLLELALLLQIAEVTSWQFTLTLVVATGILGTLLARSQGFRTYRAITRSLEQGVIPTGPLMDGVLILVAGTVLVTPGIITDLVGFALLIPWTRSWIRNGLRYYFATHVNVTVSRSETSSQDQSKVVDSYVIDSCVHDADDSRS